MRGSESAFLELVGRRVVFLDGAMGTSIHALDLPLSDYNGLENCCEVLNLTRPDAVEQIHRSFLEVGCDAVETNTFGGMRHVLAEFGLADRCYEINVAAAKIARRACEAFSTPQRPRFVVGSLGPGTKLPTLRQISYDGLLESYGEQARGLIDGGCDAMLIETCQDILHAKAVIWAVLSAFERTGKRLPLMVQVTMETTGTMLVGTDVAAALVAIEAYPEVDVIGLNCATGPQEMSEHVRYLARNSTRPISVMPNAGLPQLVGGRTHFPLAPAELARWLKEFVDVDGVRIVGGCCGTTPGHLRAVVEAIGFDGNAESNAERRMQNAESGASSPNAVASGVADSGTSRPAPESKDASAFCIPHSAFVTPQSRSREAACSSLYQATPYRQDNSFLIVGERSNTNGSRQFKRLLAEGDIEGLVQMGVEQVREGSHVLDLCVDYVGRDGVADMTRVADRYAVDVNVPLMLDSTEPEVIEAGLKLIGGKCIINSVNLEDGEVKMARVARLLRQYGAAVVALTIDEDLIESMAKTAQRKLEIATRIHDLLTHKYGVAEEDIFFDCLTFPITTGNEADRRLALETLDGIEAVMARFPRCQSILGVSNVSFGLVPAARAVLNSVFLHEARERGLTAAIVHSSKILPRNQISDERWEAALELIYAGEERGTEARRHGGTEGNAPASGAALERYIGLFSEGEQVGTKVKIDDLPIEERLKRRIIDGEKIGLDADLAVALQTYPPLDIINNLLLDGMKTVGDLFGSGQMQLPFVLKSAETMKAAVALLEPHMDRSADTSRGKIVLATVRGDVHDIGKNLVDIILTNNGYRVFNLGIKQPINSIIAAWREHDADAIGLSGLLVKSTLVMRDDLLVLEEQGIRVPVILGGAALTRGYVENDLRPLYGGSLSYAKDAFEGLRLMGEICDKPATKRRSDEATEGEGRAQPSPDRKGGVRPGQTPVRAQGRSEPVPNEKLAEPSPATQPPRRLDLDAEQRFGLAAVGETAEDDDGVADEPLVAASEIQRPLVAASAIERAPAAAPARRRSEIPFDNPIPAPPFWGARVLEHIPLKAALGYMNEIMLFQVQWGFRKRGRGGDDFRRYIDRDVRPIYRELVERCEREAILLPQAIYGYWPCNSDGDDLIIWAPLEEATKMRVTEEGARISDEATQGKPVKVGAAATTLTPRAASDAETNLPLCAAVAPRTDDSAAPSLRRSVAHSGSPLGHPHLRRSELARFSFPRQKHAPFWCLSDFWRPVESGQTDVIALSLVTAGRRVSEVAREWFAANEYQQYLFLHGLGVETAEALAEYVHKQVRMELGIAERDARERQKLFQQGYQGSRFSFGYPACPNLEDQTKLMQLLEPQRIGVTLSEEYQLDPEQSTSAVIAHHPAARYFNVR